MHILAGILAFVDKNRNMDLLRKGSAEWKTRLWLDVLNSPNVTELKYADLLIQKQNTMLPEFRVEGTSYKGLTFGAKMPFSWLIFKLIDKLWTHAGCTEGTILQI